MKKMVLVERTVFWVEDDTTVEEMEEKLNDGYDPHEDEESPVIDFSREVQEEE